MIRENAVIADVLASVLTCIVCLSFYTAAQRVSFLGTDEEEEVRRLYGSGFAMKLATERRNAGLEVSEVADISIPSYEEHLISSQDDLQKKAKLRQTFSTLTLSQKNILTMRFYKGMSYEDIASQLGITKRTVYNQIHTVIKKIRQAINEH